MLKKIFDAVQAGKREEIMRQARHDFLIGVHEGDREKIRDCIKKDVDINTMMHLAAGYRAESLAMLIHHGGDIHHIEPDKPETDTPLMTAARLANARSIYILVKCGADYEQTRQVILNNPAATQKEQDALAMIEQAVNTPTLPERKALSMKHSQRTKQIAQMRRQKP